MHDLWGSLGNTGIKIVRDLRAQEQQVLSPLLEVAQKVGPGREAVVEVAQMARQSLTSAPGHLLRRISAPQLGVVVAAARAGAGVVSKRMRASG